MTDDSPRNILARPNARYLRIPFVSAVTPFSESCKRSLSFSKTLTDGNSASMVILFTAEKISGGVKFGKVFLKELENVTEMHAP